MSERENRIYITGSQGFIGSNLYQYFKSLELEVFGCSVDITDYEAVQKEINTIKPTIIIHSAAIVSSILCNIAESYAFDVNVKGTYNVASAGKKIGAKFIYLGSSASYYPQQAEIFENSPVKPQTLYGLTKWLGEETARHIYADELLILRLVYVYGPNDGHSGIWTIIDSALNRKPVILLMSPDSFKDYLYIDDAVEAISIAATKNLRGIYNISYGNPIKLGDVVNIVLDELAKRKIKPPSIIYRPSKDYLGNHIVSSFGFKNRTDWSPRIGLIEGVQRCLQTSFRHTG